MSPPWLARWWMEIERRSRRGLVEQHYRLVEPWSRTLDTNMESARTATIATIANAAYRRGRRELLDGGSRVGASGIILVEFVQISAGAALSEFYIYSKGILRILPHIYWQLNSCALYCHTHLCS